MAWYDEDSWLTWAFAPKLSTIALSLLFVILLPLVLHQYLYKKQTSTNLPSILLVGPSGAGKTALATLLDRGTPSPTHTSTSPLTVPALLPESHTPHSAGYRSAGDPAYERARRFLIHDTPGHGKLRHFATSRLVNPTHLHGIIFVVDAAAIAEEAGLNEAADYLHDVLLALQKRYTSATTSKGPKEIPVLVAANKLDLFTALPPHLVRIALEKKISEVRKRRARGLKDSGVGLGDGAEAEDVGGEEEWLGEGGEGPFEFGMMEEVGSRVEVKGGNAVGKAGIDVDAWWKWIAECL